MARLMVASLFSLACLAGSLRAESELDSGQCDREAAYRRYAKRCLDAQEQRYRDAVRELGQLAKHRAQAKRAIVRRDGDTTVPVGYKGQKFVDSEAERREVIDSIDAAVKVHREVVAVHRSGNKWVPADLPPKPSLGDMGGFGDTAVKIISVSGEQAEIERDGQRYMYAGETRDLVAGQMHVFDPHIVVLADSSDGGRLVLRSDSLIGVAAEIRKLREVK